MTHKLKEYGYNAAEFSEFVGDLLNYKDDDNHVVIDPIDKVMFIILNKPLERRVNNND